MKKTTFKTALKRVAVLGAAIGLLAGGFGAMVTGVPVMLGALCGAAAWGGLLTVSALAMKAMQVSGINIGPRRFGERHSGPSANGLPFETLKRMRDQSLRAQFQPKYALPAQSEIKITIRPAKTNAL